MTSHKKLSFGNLADDDWSTQKVEDRCAIKKKQKMTWHKAVDGLRIVEGCGISNAREFILDRVQAGHIPLLGDLIVGEHLSQNVLLGPNVFSDWRINLRGENWDIGLFEIEIRYEEPIDSLADIWRVHNAKLGKRELTKFLGKGFRGQPCSKPNLSEAAFLRWKKDNKKELISLSHNAILLRCKEDFPENKITRDRVRAAFPNRKPGPKPKYAKK